MLGCGYDLGVPHATPRHMPAIAATKVAQAQQPFLSM